MVGSGLRLTCSRQELVEKLAVVSRAVSMRPTVQILSGIWLQATDGTLELAATDMELSLRSSLDAEIAEPGTVVLPGRLLVDIAKLLPASEVEIAHSPEEGRVLGRLRLRQLLAPHPLRRGLSAASRGRRRADVLRRSRSAARDDHARGPLGLARRVAPGPHGNPRPFRRGEAGDGRDRLLPPGREGDRDRGLGARARGDRARARADGAGPHCRRRGDGRPRRAREPRGLPRRRRAAHHAADRRPVPGLPPAHPGAVRARGAAPRGRSCSTSCGGSR